MQIGKTPVLHTILSKSASSNIPCPRVNFNNGHTNKCTCGKMCELFYFLTRSFFLQKNKILKNGTKVEHYFQAKWKWCMVRWQQSHRNSIPNKQPNPKYPKYTVFLQTTSTEKQHISQLNKLVKSLFSFHSSLF